MADALEALFGEKTEAPATTPTPEAPAAPARDESGRFAAKTTEPPAVEAVKTPEPPKPASSEHGGLSGPALAAVLDERDKRKKLETELAELRSKQQQPEPVPSIQEDPEGFERYVNDQVARVELNTRFTSSERFAVKEHGKDAVEAAKEWGMTRAQASPAFAQEYARNDDPIAWIVRQHKRDRLVSELGDDDAAQKAYIERRARELGLIPATTPTPPSASAPAAPQPTPTPKPDPFRQFDSATSAGGAMSGAPQAHPVMERLFGKT